MTPPEIYSVRSPGSGANGPGWRIRAFPNLHPALRVEDAGQGNGEGPYDRMGGLGAHEVIVEDPDRNADLARMDPHHVFEVLSAWRARLGDLRRDGRLACGVVFKNRGWQAGATVLHPHSQLLAMPFVPPVLAGELSAISAYRSAHGRCPMCDALRHERALGDRLVLDGKVACVVAPYASRVPFEIMVAPVAHQAAFEEADDNLLHEIAWLLREGMARLDRTLAQPAYHLWLRTAPWRLPETERVGYHWHVSVLPAIDRYGAFENATGTRINTVLPEEAAAALREQ